MRQNSFINSARAAQTDADFNAYCRSKFPNSSYQKLLQSWGTEHACVQGGTRQGIDFAEACRMTTGSRNYQVSGMRVLCEGSVENVESSQPKVIGEPDFNQYCRNNFPNSVYEKRVESYGVAHYCRRPGITGFTLQNIDLSRACRESLGTVPMADQIKREAEQKATECDFPPMCPQIAFEQTFQGYMNIVTIWQCHLMFIEHPEGKEHDDIKTAIEEACEIEKRLDQMSENLMSLGASMNSPVHEQLISWLEVKSVCEESDFDLYFVFADTAGSTIEGALPMGVPLAVELRYKRAPKNYEQSVKLELGENFSTSMELSVFPVEGNPKRFRSSPFTLIMPEI
ncbi:hypothetical protein BOW34_12755 [Solemya velum gill symbiont]|nr:hypothetical protein BOW34_12755 [Solemya velum gill symbiont]